MTLNDVKQSSDFVVTHVHVTGSLRQRLYDLGICPGTKISFVRSAPLTDPIQVQIGHYHVALRRSEAQYVEVKTYVE